MPRHAESESFLVTALRASGVTLLLVVMVAVWAWRLHPGPPPADPSLEARMRTLTTLTSYAAQAPDSLRLAAITALAWLPDETLQALHDWRFESAERQVRLLTVQSGPVDSGPLHAGLLFAALKTANWASLEGTHLMISASGKRLPDELKIDALRLLSAKALAAHDAETAMEILQRAIRIAPADWDLLQEALGICRQAFRPDLALKLLHERMNDARHPLPDARHQEAMDLEMALMIRAGRSKEALALAEERSQLRPTDPHTIERLANAASFAGLPSRALPALDQFLANQPLHKLNPAELTQQTDAPDTYRRALELHARLADEAGDARRSRDSLLRLAALGDMRFVGRLAELAKQDPRDQTWAAIQAQLPDPLSAAQAALDAGQPAVAEGILTTHVKAKPDQLDAAFLLVQVQTKRAETAQSQVQLWDRFTHAHPTHSAGLRELALAHESAGQTALAMRTLKALPDKAHNASSLQALHRLALKQGDIATALQSQKFLLEHSSDASPADYLHLAHLQHLGTDNATSTTALLAGLDRFPDNTLLRERLNRESHPEIRPAKAVFAAEAE